MANYQLYQEILSSAAHGTPLWEPGPSTKQIAPSIGDVGYLRFGAFIRLFNATLPVGHPDNEYGEPENYVPLTVKPASVRRVTLPKGVVASSGVQITFHSKNETNDDSHIDFKCTDKAGAVLMTDSDVYRHDVTASILDTFSDYMVAHAQSFAKFAQSELMHEVAMHELTLLTGCDTIRGKYSVTVFNSARISRRADTTFRLSRPALNCHTWSHSPAIGYFQHNYGHGCSDAELCLFVRGFKIMDRYVEKVERNDTAQSWFVHNCSVDRPRGPLDAVLRYLSDNCDTGLAVAHDNDLSRLSGKDNSPLDYRGLLKRLRKARCPIIARGQVASLA